MTVLPLFVGVISKPASQVASFRSEGITAWSEGTYSEKSSAYGLCLPHVCVLVAQLCPTLWNPMDCSPSGPSVHGILQARILKWVAMPFSSGSFWPRGWTLISCIAGVSFATREALLMPVLSHSVVSDSATPWTSPPGSSVHGDSPGKNTGVGCHAFLQGNFPTQGLNPGLLHCRWILLPAELPGKPVWIIYSPKNGTF